MLPKSLKSPPALAVKMLIKIKSQLKIGDNYKINNKNASKIIKIIQKS
jgi:hypothetical protein